MKSNLNNNDNTNNAKKFFGTSPPINKSGTTITVDGSLSDGGSGSVKVNQPIPCC